MKSSGAEPDVYRRAARAARVAVDFRPEDGGILTTLGVALYRAGDWASALEALTRSDQLNEGREPADVAFLALSHFHLDYAEAAQAELVRLRGLVERPASGHVPDMEHAFLAEAEALIEEPSSEPGEGR